MSRPAVRFEYRHSTHARTYGQVVIADRSRPARVVGGDRSPTAVSASGAAVRSTPAPVAPGQIPARPVRQSVGDEVEPRGSPGMASRQPGERYPGARPKTEALDCLVGVGGAGRQMPAMESDQRGERVAI